MQAALFALATMGTGMLAGTCGWFGRRGSWVVCALGIAVALLILAVGIRVGHF